MDDLRQAYSNTLEGNGPIMAVCPVHGDTNPSLAIYANGAKCFGCGRYWNAKDFASQFNSVDIRVIYQSKHSEKGPGYIPVSMARTYQRWLLGPFRHKMDWLEKRGFTEATIKRYGFGYSPGVYTIPIFSVTGKALYGMRFRRDDSYSLDGPKYYGLAGNNNVALYISRNVFLPKPAVYLCEGELDAALLDSYGLPAVSFTNGANAMRREMVRYFSRVQRVYVCYDQDEAGETGAINALELLGTEKGVRVYWPLRLGKDVGELIQSSGIGEFNRWVMLSLLR